MIQSQKDLDYFHNDIDPWNYEKSNDDLIRREILLREISAFSPKKILDIGCGQGFITSKLNADEIIGLDISSSAIEHAKHQNKNKKIRYLNLSIFELFNCNNFKFDMILITGVLYPQYIGDSSSLIYTLIDKILQPGGILVNVHIDNWYNCSWPYIKIKDFYYPYRNYTHKFEIFRK